MATHLSAIKRIRQTKRRLERNKTQRSRLKTAIKAVTAAIQKKDKKAAETALLTAVSVLDKAAKKRLIHPNNADRRKSRLSLQVHTL